jgi:hypothetical protein
MGHALFQPYLYRSLLHSHAHDKKADISELEWVGRYIPSRQNPKPKDLIRMSWDHEYCTRRVDGDTPFHAAISSRPEITEEGWCDSHVQRGYIVGLFERQACDVEWLTDI